MNSFDFTSLDDTVVHGLTLLEKLVPIIILITILFLIFKYHNQIQGYKHEKKIRYTLGILMLIGELSYLTWNFIHSLSDKVYFIGTLPLHLCSYAIWGIAIVMFTMNKKLYNFVFIFAFTGVLALLFPNLNHGMDSFRYYQLYFSHSLLLIGCLYLYKVHNFYPTKKDLIHSFIFLQIIIAFSLVINVVLNTEYLFIGPGNKPIDFAWDWPWHMIEYELFMFVVYYVAYLILKNRKAKISVLQ